MPELPDIELYRWALASRIVGQTLERVRLSSPFVLRSVSPAPAHFEGRRITSIERIGKRLAWRVDEDGWIVIHLMIGGRLRWKERGAALPGRLGLAAFDFPSGSVLMTEAGTKKRASIHLVGSRAALAEHDRGGLEPLIITLESFAGRLRSENHTLKRALTDPHLFSGIGNAYSDEILHAARLSPVMLTHRIADDEVARLFAAMRSVLSAWTRRLREEAGEAFPEKVTAFRDGMAVHGRFGQPCPTCQSPVQRISYAANECNYCPVCQTGGRLLADRGLSRLLGRDWPRTLEELEGRRGR
jgi:formamidopyrimidine-DNA glycosylase